MKRTTSTPKTSSQPRRAPAIHTPQLPQNFERIRKRAEELYAARSGMIGMTLNDWLKAEQELKQEVEKKTNNK
jgi:hypothetical protein